MAGELHMIERLRRRDQCGACAVPGCGEVARYRASWSYPPKVLMRRGWVYVRRQATSGRCTRHARAFARRYDLPWPP